MRRHNIYYYSLLIVHCSLFTGSGSCFAGDGNGVSGASVGVISRFEGKGDRLFSRGHFSRAMGFYSRAVEASSGAEESARLHLKTARLYLSLSDYSSSLPHYDSAMCFSRDLLSSRDVCHYVDGLRYSGDKEKAISVLRSYALRDIDNPDRRFANILHSLNYGGVLENSHSPGFVVSRTGGVCSSNSEYSVGLHGNKLFYAVSGSGLGDPSKIVYHRSRYGRLPDVGGSLSGSVVSSPEPSHRGTSGSRDILPLHINEGPMSFSGIGDVLVVTCVSYNNRGRDKRIVVTPYGLNNSFPTKLVYSRYNSVRGGWGAFRPVFAGDDNSSCAHGFLFNAGMSLFFSSDRPGGYGGFDLYVSHWDAVSRSWGTAVNLGPSVNTEGDEITPSVHGGILLFSSNGHGGHGGYDNYSVCLMESDGLLSGSVVEGSLLHFGSPVNSVLNDFGMLPVTGALGYLVSDRVPSQRDDVYFFERVGVVFPSCLSEGSGSSGNADSFTSDAAIASGLVGLYGLDGEFNGPRRESLPGFRDEEGMLHMLSVYFDFDRHNLRPDAAGSLQSWFSGLPPGHVDNLVIDGFADEIGNAAYNLVLSRKRAESVASWFRSHDCGCGLVVTGHGETVAPVSDETPPAGINSDQGSLSYRIWKNRLARRVDVRQVINNE